MQNTILITGCSSGFGLATASLFLARGWNVVATMRSPQPELFAEDPRLLVTALDVTRPESIASAIAAGIAHFGRIDALVNNAGIGMFGAHETTSDEVIRQIFATNTFGIMASNRAIIPHLRERETSTIINVTSSVCSAPMPLVAAYAASKWAIEGFSEALAHELAEFGVRVKIVQPGLAPATRFASNSGDRVTQAPAPYADFAGRFFKAMGNAPTAYTDAQNVAEAVYAAANDGTSQLRYAAGADSVMLAELRRSLPEADFLSRVRTMTGGRSDERDTKRLV